MTVWGVEADRVARLVSEAFHFGRQVGVEEWQAMGGAKFYGQRHEYLGATLLSEYLSKGAEDNTHVVMPGAACAVGVDALLQLLTRLRIWSVRCAVAPGPGGRRCAFHPGGRVRGGPGRARRVVGEARPGRHGELRVALVQRRG